MKENKNKEVKRTRLQNKEKEDEKKNKIIKT